MENDTKILDIQKKINQYRSYIELDAENPQLLISLGDLYHTLSMCDEACDCYEKSLAIEDSSIALSRLGAVKITQHAFHDAENIYRNLLENGSDNPVLLFNLALAQYHLKNWDGAISHFERALTAGADSIKCLAYLTRCHHHKHDFRKARKCCAQWQEQAGDSTAAGYRALIEMDSGNSEQALKMALQVLDEDPNNSDATIIVGTSDIENQDIASAQAHFKKVLGREENHPRALFGLGLTYMHSQDHPTAINYMKMAAEQMPTDTGIKIAIGWSQIASHDYDSAEKTFQETIDIDRNFAEGHGGLAYVHALRGKMQQAKKEMETAQWLDPGSFGAVASRSVITGYEQGNQKATEYLAAVLERSPGPGQKPIIEHIQTYIDKHGTAEQTDEQKQ